MAISFPLSVPAFHAIRSVRFGMVDNVGSGESPYTFTEETFEHAGKRWTIDIELRPMLRADAEEWVAFLATLRGKRGTFLLGDPVGSVARGALGGTPLVAGAGQSGQTINIDGCTPSVTNWLRKGDWVQEGSGSTARLHKSLTDVNTDGSGAATLELWPGPRAALADNAALVFAGAQSVWRLTSNRREYDVGLAQVYGLTFSAKEAL